MNKQKGSAAVWALIGVLVVILGLAGIAAMGWWNASVYASKIEPQLVAEYENNQNILAQGQQMVQEAAQVTGMLTEDQAKIIKDAVTGRYGADGAKATWLMLKEQNPQLDASLYKKVQQLIESYRIEFKNSQTKLIDIKRQYESYMQHPWTGLWARMAGLPHVDLNKFKPIITDRVEEVYAKGKEAAPLKVR